MKYPTVSVNGVSVRVDNDDQEIDKYIGESKINGTQWEEMGSTGTNKCKSITICEMTVAIETILPAQLESSPQRQ